VRRRGRRLTAQDAREVAALCALRASEVEACATLNIPISSWKHWKGRAKNNAEYDDILNALRAAKIKGHLENVEKFSAKDWRASIAYLEKCLPERYSSAAERKSVEVNVSYNPSLHVQVDIPAALAAYRKLKAADAKQQAVVEIEASAKPVLAIENAKPVPGGEDAIGA
jgi:hypothetical protein